MQGTPLSAWLERMYYIVDFEYDLLSQHLDQQAHHKGLSYPQYVWITHGWYPEQWWNISQEVYGNQTDTCSSEEVAAFLNGVIAIQPFPTADDRYAQTESGMVSSYII